MTNDEMLKATSGRDTDDEPWPEDRIDIVGQNGNDGLIYEEVQADLSDENGG